MASSSKSFSFFIFLIILSIFYSQIQARESEFFNKAVRFDTTEKPESVRNGVPAKKEETPSTVNPQDRNGYGLYGHDPNQYTPTTTPTTNENYNAGRKSPTAESEYTNNLYGNKQYGMSDTRSLENGRYFYDLKNENSNRNKYESGTGDRFGNENSNRNEYESGTGDRYGNENSNRNEYESGTGDRYGNENYNRNEYESGTGDRYGNENYYRNGYGATRGTDSRGKYNNGGYYGGNENADEYNNTPIDNHQEEYQNEFVP